MTKNYMTDIASIASLDPRVAVFAIGAACIVALGGMALGYDVDLTVLGNGIRLSKPQGRTPLLH